MIIGDRVVCIDDTFHTDYKGNASALKRGREYIVYDIDVCSCGVAFDVGLVIGSDAERCYGCGQTLRGDVWWANARRFKKVEDKKEYKVVHSNIKIKKPNAN